MHALTFQRKFPFQTEFLEKFTTVNLGVLYAKDNMVHYI